MHITRRKELTVRMGDYETFKFSAEVGVTHRDFGLQDTDPITPDIAEGMQSFITEQLDLALQADIDDAVELTQDRNSFLAQAFRPAPLTRTKNRRNR